jgi:hypothetical protein
LKVRNWVSTCGNGQSDRRDWRNGHMSIHYCFSLLSVLFIAFEAHSGFLCDAQWSDDLCASSLNSLGGVFGGK